MPILPIFDAYWLPFSPFFSAWSSRPWSSGMKRISRFVVEPEIFQIRNRKSVHLDLEYADLHHRALLSVFLLRSSVGIAFKVTMVRPDSGIELGLAALNSKAARNTHFSKWNNSTAFSWSDTRYLVLGEPCTSLRGHSNTIVKRKSISHISTLLSVR